MSGPVTVRANVSNAVRVEFYTVRDVAGEAAQLTFTDNEGSDGWDWRWEAPACCWRGRVWAVAYFANGAQANSPSYLASTPDWLGTPAP